MTDDDHRLRRVPTGEPGLDEVLDGGLLAGAVYIVRGTPGAGKTILANQICVHHASSGERALFVTLLAESHARMLLHMERLDFFDATLVPKQLYYVSGFRTLEAEGLKGFMAMLRHEMRAHQATLLVLDGLISIEESSESDREFRKFIHELQAHAAASDCTVLLLTDGSRAEYHPENTMVDGLISLVDTALGKRKQRELEVLKFRGSGFLRGRHSYRISDAGITIYPRIEAALTNPTTPDDPTNDKMSLGVPKLDAMLFGGVPVGSSTFVLGTSGAGKTTLGLHFITQSSAGEPGLVFGFYETPQRLVLNAANVGLDLRGAVERGDVEILWRPLTEQILDDVAEQLVAAVRRRGVKRLVVDGLNGLAESSDVPVRLNHAFAVLCNEFRSLGVTTIWTAETRNLIGPEVEMPVGGAASIADNSLLLRFVEYRARLYRVLSITKVRGNPFDNALREYRITDNGIDLADTFEGAEAILSGFGTQTGSPADKRRPPPRRPDRG